MSREALVIGGGIAGSVAACLLARKGRSVRLFEKEPGPHHKVCGEFISGEVHADLLHLGLDIEALGAKRIETMRLTVGGKTTACALPFSAFSLSRMVLDHELLQLAARAGATINQGMTVKALQKVQDRWQATVANKTIFADDIYLASGKHELRSWARSSHKSDFIGFKMHYTGILPVNAEVEIILFQGGYAGIEPIENGINLCLAVSKKAFSKCGGEWDILLSAITDSAPRLRFWLDGAKPHWPRPKTIARIPYGFLQRPHDTLHGLYRLGDQMAVIPSFAGSGMAIAVKTAILATDSTDSATYQRKAYSLLRQPLSLASGLQLIPPKALVSICQFFPSFIPHVAEWTRIGSRGK